MLIILHNIVLVFFCIEVDRRLETVLSKIIILFEKGFLCCLKSISDGVCRPI